MEELPDLYSLNFSLFQKEAHFQGNQNIIILKMTEKLGSSSYYLPLLERTALPSLLGQPHKPLVPQLHSSLGPAFL